MLHTLLALALPRDHAAPRTREWCFAGPAGSTVILYGGPVLGGRFSVRGYVLAGSTIVARLRPTRDTATVQAFIREHALPEPLVRAQEAKRDADHFTAGLFGAAALNVSVLALFFAQYFQF